MYCLSKVGVSFNIDMAGESLGVEFDSHDVLKQLTSPMKNSMYIAVVCSIIFHRLSL